MCLFRPSRDVDFIAAAVLVRRSRDLDCGSSLIRRSPDLDCGSVLWFDLAMDGLVSGLP